MHWISFSRTSSRRLPDATPSRWFGASCCFCVHGNRLRDSDLVKPNIYLPKSKAINDVFETGDTALKLLEDLVNALPEFGAYASIFKDSEIQMIKGSLVTLYQEIILFAVEAIKLVKPGLASKSYRSYPRALWFHFKLP